MKLLVVLGGCTICSWCTLFFWLFRVHFGELLQAGIEGLARADAEIGNILPEGIDKTKEGYKREILRLRIENERLKKKYLVRQNEDGQTEYVRLKMKSSK